MDNYLHVNYSLQIFYKLPSLAKVTTKSFKKISDTTHGQIKENDSFNSQEVITLGVNTH